MVAVDAITKGNAAYAAAAGKISAAGSVYEGVAMETSADDGDVIEVLDMPHVDLVAAGGITLPTVTFNGVTTANKLIMTDDLADALNVVEGANSYLKFTTSNGTEAITVGKATTFAASVAVGTTLAVTGVSTLAGNVANTAGVGITGTADSYVTSVEKIGSIIKTTILIEVDGLNSGGTADDIVGADGAGVAHLGQITAAVNGTIFAGKITCLETPTGGDPDVDLWYANEATGVENTAISALTGETQCIDHGDWTGGEQGNLTAMPAADKYLYLTTGDATEATYTAGIFLIELYGKAA
jgi:hypothetical protein